MNTRTIVLGMMLLAGMASYGYAQEAVKAADAPAAVEHKFCPVCGPHEEMEELPVIYKHDGKKYAFCSMGCMKAFKKNPEAYVHDHVEHKTQ